MTLIGIELSRSLENPVKSHVERVRTPFYVIVGKNIEIASFHIFDSRPRHGVRSRATVSENAVPASDFFLKEICAERNEDNGVYHYQAQDNHTDDSVLPVAFAGFVTPDAMDHDVERHKADNYNRD